MISLVLLTLQCASGIRPAPDVAVFDTGRQNQMAVTFSPDGETAFWVTWNGQWGSQGERRTIVTSRCADGRWTRPGPVPFSSEYDDDDPFVSPDGRWLYFVSTRPPDVDSEETKGDIWRYRLEEPERLERLTLNSEAAEYSPVVTSNGTLYFASARKGGYGQGDLYRAERLGEEFAAPEALGPALNHATGEWNLWVSADETEIIFEASSRASNITQSGDLYYSWRTPSGWSPAMPIEELNSAGSDLMPRLHPDGSRLYYTTAPIGGHARLATVDWRSLRADIRARSYPPLIVANRSSHDVSIVDLARSVVTSRIATGEGPHLLSNVAGQRVIATGYGEFPEPHDEPVTQRPPFVEELNSRVTLIDTEAGKAVTSTVLDGCLRPHASWIVEERLFVVCEDEARVLEVDLESSAVLRIFGTGQEGSHVLAYEPVSRILSVSNTESGSLTLINIDSGRTDVVQLGRGTEGAIAVDGRVWAANAQDGTLSVVDPVHAREIHRSARLCGFPIAMDIGRNSLLWLACFGSSELIAISRDDYTPIRRWRLSSAPLNIAVHPHAELAYLSVPRANAIDEIDLVTGEVIRRIPVGIEPDGLRWAERNECRCVHVTENCR